MTNEFLHFQWGECNKTSTQEKFEVFVLPLTTRKETVQVPIKGPGMTKSQPFYYTENKTTGQLAQDLDMTNKEKDRLRL